MNDNMFMNLANYMYRLGAFMINRLHFKWYGDMQSLLSEEFEISKIKKYIHKIYCLFYKTLHS